MTLEEAISILQEKHRECKSFYDLAAHPEEVYPETTKFLFALERAIASLRPVSREQVEKVWPGCPYCKEDGEGYIKKFGAYSIQNGELATGHCKSWKIKFCPHCSRPLTDEAVEMVTERMNKLHD